RSKSIERDASMTSITSGVARWSSTVPGTHGTLSVSAPPAPPRPASRPVRAPQATAARIHTLAAARHADIHFTWVGIVRAERGACKHVPRTAYPAARGTQYLQVLGRTDRLGLGRLVVDPGPQSEYFIGFTVTPVGGIMQRSKWIAFAALLMSSAL